VHYPLGMHDLSKNRSKTRCSLVCSLFVVISLILSGSTIAQSYLPECPDGRDPGLWDLMNRAIDSMYQADPMGIGPLLNDESRNDQLSDVSSQAIEARTIEMLAMLRELQDIDRSDFSDTDHLDADLLIYQWIQNLTQSEFRSWQMPVTSIGGPQVWLPQMGDRVPWSTEKHYNDYLTRLKRVPIMVGDEMDNMRLGMLEGRVPPRVVIEPTVAQALAQASTQYREDPSQSPFYSPFRSLDQESQVAIDARKVIAERIIPVYQELAVFLQNVYLPACRDTIGAAQGVDGIGAYNSMIASHTTLPEMSANDVHQAGLDEVARIRAEMFEVIKTSDWFERSDSYMSHDDLFESFVEYLRTDERFYYSEPDDLLNGYRVISKMVDPELTKLFGTLPRLTYGVRALPAFSAESAPTAYYYPGSLQTAQPGYFMANLSLLDQRPKYEMIALTLHEAVPGHHFQISIAQEIKNQHPIRKTMGFTGFVEGWALYAEKLGLEMGDGEHGFYQDPYDNFGRLNFEMWRAMRLVVDTGMHSKGWSRERAVEFMRSNSALALHNIESEINRYIGWPGQATGYKIGELKILEIRKVAQETLGDRFDIRAFHDEMLGDGALPLPVLEQKMSRWVESQ
jgi:uncharacterized protein (DUF885 family)